jgi:predicted patatin/cPLA2 family phospholipase
MTHEIPIADSQSRKALILPGGGMRVAWQAGAVKALHEHGLRYSVADGASGGTMNLAALLSGISPDELCRRWRALNIRRFISLRSPVWYLRFPAIGAFGDFDGIRDTIFPGLGIDVGAIRQQRDIAASFNLCEFDSKTVMAVAHGAVTLEHLLAAISLPLATPAVSIDGKTYTDAVWIQDCNLIEAVRQGANELWVLWCIANTPRYSPHLVEQYVHMIEMSALGSLHEQFAQLQAINEDIARGNRPFGQDAPITVHLIRPEFPIPLDFDLVAGRTNSAELIGFGYRDAMTYLEAMTENGTALSPKSTRMQIPPKGVSFREVMSGRITFGQTDPQTGYRDPGAVPVSLNASIVIRDLDRFIADPLHPGELTGHLYAPRLGQNPVGWNGRFRLFSPGSDSSVSEMVYATNYRQEGRALWFDGRKFVRNGFRPWRVWTETTTLHVKIRPDPESDEVLAAGILRLNIFQLLTLLSTAQSSGCQTTFEQAKYLLRFFGFFARQIWRAYFVR